MEARRFEQRMHSRPPSAARLDDLPKSGLTRNGVPVARTASQAPADPDNSVDEIDFLSREKMTAGEAIKAKGLRFNKKKKPSGDAESGTDSGAGSRPPLGTKDRGRGRDESCDAAERSTARPLRENGSRRNNNASPETRTNQAGEAKRRVPPPRSESVEVVDDEPGPSKRRKQLERPSIPQISPNAKGKARAVEPQPKPKRVALPYPQLSPVKKGKEKESEVERPRPRPRPTRLKGEGKPEPPKLKAQPFPLDAPLKLSPSASASSQTKFTSPARKAAEFPAISPLQEELSKPKKKKQQLEARPFPMDNMPLVSRVSPGKRRSSDLEIDSDDEPGRKRTRNRPRASVDFLDVGDDSLFMPHADPKTLCPYCDCPLPLDPTPHLKKLMEATYRKSQPDPRPANPLGRKAPMASFIAVCQRHRFENETLPEAEAKGWPKSIDWEDVRLRVQAMEYDLRRIVQDGNDENVAPDGSQGRKGPRRGCLFWRDMMKELKAKGTKAVQGVQAQFANFHKTQPGYYGEMGSVIIHQTLYDMFPLTEIEPQLVNPLTPNEFIQRILVPEVGMRLVMQDMDLDIEDSADKKQAVAVLQDSATYGVAMFPDDSGRNNGDDVDVGEQLIMQRAMRRRAELEAEEKREEEEAARREERAKRRAMKKAREEEEDEPAESEQLPAERPRPKPKPKPRLKQPAESGMESESDAAMPPTGTQNSIFSADLGPRSRSRSRSRQLSEDDAPVRVASTKRAASKKRGSSVLEIASSSSDSDARPPSRTRSSAKSNSKSSSEAEMMISSSDGDSDAAVLVSPKMKAPKARRRAQTVTSAAAAVPDTVRKAVTTKRSKLLASSDDEDHDATPRPAARTAPVAPSASKSNEVYSLALLAKSFQTDNSMDNFNAHRP
ncbi:RTC4 domain-containing protein [Mycena chlorophos]|uniref:Restriction of telomere capping protein 4 n=1 Tax=Mycena chlorophos TaxID=658473 RepID=A0A8H6SEB9_MYCCL|nr:RTC4 domain-containing protein [Mycena chlorophos]